MWVLLRQPPRRAACTAAHINEDSPLRHLRSEVAKRRLECSAERLLSLRSVRWEVACSDGLRR
eukprot:scaffold52813_cov41-Tisochrysis_lutea.AAC.2